MVRPWPMRKPVRSVWKPSGKPYCEGPKSAFPGLAGTGFSSLYAAGMWKFLKL
jgi:hypothetical protein